jgi:hypothetical protein
MDESTCAGVVHLFIKLTNTAGDHAGESICINVDHITAIYEHAKVKDGGITTFVHGRVGAPITWEVEESASQVMKLIEESNAKRQGCSCK